ncbi:pseudouridine synthase [Caldinitratiruptor microaerophilus]|uniref:Pseudouridine synthase n=1 Tax=Caldinitratiruptor microaerophilus TaxID=671077 RepID=A0AA35CK49_9FIRM|nr:pseudouridine synthase [Caldinitratiruptor microaerophilus]BDG59979.1 hypothetical protein caldi_10690 [Caldinitratiruptor microaerophilus]
MARRDKPTSRPESGRKKVPGREDTARRRPAPGRRRAAETGLVTGEPERLQKILARAGVASRRHSEELILAGRVRVNGEVVTRLGTRAVAGVDRIEVDGRPIGEREPLAYVVLNKPKGYVTTLHDPEGRPTVVDLIEGAPVRLYPVGRLDYDTEGLLLLTNDGELAHALAHPSSEVSKTYVARVRGVPTAAKLRTLEQGVRLEDGITAPARVRLLAVRTDRRNPRNQVATVELTIHEGRNRQVRRMLAAVGHEVIQLTRTRVGPLRLAGLAPGEFRYLTLRDIKSLRHAAGLPADPPGPLAPVPAGPERGAAGVPEPSPAPSPRRPPSRRPGARQGPAGAAGKPPRKEMRRSATKSSRA